MPLTQTIEKFKNYISLLDEVYKNASTSSVLDGDTSLVSAGANANEIVIPKMQLQGLADYSRNSGYVARNVKLTNETVQFNYDRGGKFSVDNMDDEETAGVAFGKLSSEFMRTQVVPEVDAFRYATYAGTSGISTTSGATLDTGDKVLAALLAAQNTMDEDEVGTDTRILFITPTLYNLAMSVDSYKSKAVMDSFAQIVKVPQSRFYTAIDMADGTTESEEDGGYTKADGAKDINFMIIDKSAVIQYPKHKVDKIFTPEENQSADAWQFCYREYGIADVYENKVAGIYLHKKA